MFTMIGKVNVMSNSSDSLIEVSKDDDNLAYGGAAGGDKVSVPVSLGAEYYRISMKNFWDSYSIAADMLLHPENYSPPKYDLEAELKRRNIFKDNNDE